MSIVYGKDGTKYDVPEETAARLLSTGEYSLSPDTRINVRDSAGGVSSVTGERYGRDPTLSPRSTEEEAAGIKQRTREAQYDTFGGEVKSFFGGGIETLSAGLWKPWEEEQEVNPGASIVGQIAGFVPGLFTGGAEANLARKGVQLGVEAIQAGKSVSRIAELGAAARRAYGVTAPGIAARVGRAAEALVPGAGVGARIARSAANAGAFSATDEALRQALDPDKEFSGEQLLHAAGWGALLGGGGHAAAEGIGYATKGMSRLLSREAKAIDEQAKLLEHTPAVKAADELTEWGPKVDLSRSPSGVKVRDGIAKLRQDVDKLRSVAEEAIHSPALAKAAGVDAAALKPLVAEANHAMRNMERMLASDAAPVQALSRQLHSVDELGMKLRTFSNDVPKRWTDDGVRGRFYSDMEGRLAKLPKDVDPNIVAGERLAAHLGIAEPAAAQAVREGMIGWVGKKILGERAGRLLNGSIAGGLAGGLSVAAIGEMLIENAAGSIIGGGLKLAALGMGAKLGAKALRAAFRDPAVGSLIAGSTAAVLNRAHVLPGDPDTRERDPRRALRRFAERTRRVTPDQVASKTAASLSHLAGATPMSVAAAAETAGRRHAQLMAILDRVDPVATTPLGRRLPTAADASRVADVVRVTATPNNFIVAALNGTLTPEMLAAAEAVFPATVNRMRQALLSQLATVEDPSALPARTRRLISMLLGDAGGGDEASRLAYRAAMDESAKRSREASAPTNAKAPAMPPGPVSDNRLSSPAQRASHPAGGR